MLGLRLSFVFRNYQCVFTHVLYKAVTRVDPYPVGTTGGGEPRCLRATVARGCCRRRGRQPPLPHLSGELGHSGGRCGGARACQVPGASLPPVQRVHIVRVCTQCVYSAHAVHMLCTCSAYAYAQARTVFSRKDRTAKSSPSSPQGLARVAPTSSMPYSATVLSTVEHACRCGARGCSVAWAPGQPAWPPLVGLRAPGRVR